MSEIIDLRVVVYSHNGTLRGICLETDIAVEASSMAELKGKFQDALGLYFELFSRQEIQRGEYLRPAPIVHRLVWSFRFSLHFINHLRKHITSAMKAQYDPGSNRICLA